MVYWAKASAKIVKRLANKGQFIHKITPHVLCHTFATLELKGISISCCTRKFLAMISLTLQKC